MAASDLEEKWICRLVGWKMAADEADRFFPGFGLPSRVIFLLGRALGDRELRKAGLPALPRRPRQRGYSLVELLLALALVAVLITAIFGAYWKLETERKITQEIENIGVITRNILASSASNYDFHRVSLQAAKRDLVFPKKILDQDGDPHHRWGGDIWIQAEVATPSRYFAIIYRGLPPSVCPRLIAAASAGFSEIVVWNRSVKPAGGTLDIAAVTEECNRSEREAVVGFVYRK